MYAWVIIWYDNENEWRIPDLNQWDKQFREILTCAQLINCLEIDKNQSENMCEPSDYFGL